MSCIKGKKLIGKVKKPLLVILPLILFGLTGCADNNKYEVASADGINISYEVRGEGRPVLVFVHGWCCDKSYWKFQVPYFAKRYKVVTIDLAGHGESGLERENWTIEAFGSDVTAVVGKLGLDEVILIGHSMGGHVIIEAARQMPSCVRGLVGVDTYQNFEAEYTEEQLEGFLRPFEENFVEKTRAYVRSLFAADADAELVEWVAMDISSARPEIGTGALREYFNYDVKGALKEVRKPICCVNSDMYHIYIENNRRHALSFDVKFMKGVGHFLMMEDPETFNRLLDETINGLSQ